MTDEPINPRFTVEYEGTAVGVCCRKCLTKFEADPGLYLANVPELLTVASNERAVQRDADGHEGQHADHEHEPEAAEDASHHGEEHSHPEETGTAASSSHDDEHDHAADHGSGPKLLSWIGKFHPPATDLPIGMLIGAAVAELCLIFTRKEWFRHVAGFCLALGTLGALGAVTLGWFNGGLALWDGDWVQATHRWLGTGTAVLAAITLMLYIRMTRAKSGSHPAFWYRTSLFITTSLVGAAGFFGGALVYGIDHYVW